MSLRRNTLIIGACDCKFDIHDEHLYRVLYYGNPNLITINVPIATQDIYKISSIDDILTDPTIIDTCLYYASNSSYQDKNIVMTKLRDELKNGKNIIDEIELNLGNDIDIKNVLENNPILKTKKIVLPTNFNLDELDKLYELDKKLEKYENIYVKLEGNTLPVTLKDAIKTIEILNDEVNKIKKLNLSPFETIMYVYDLVRDQEYVEEEKGTDHFISRDLTSILLGDKIVCVGFSCKFTALLRKLDIPCYDIDFNTDARPHVRNIIHVKDEKYDVDGVYFFDTTWDCKYNDTNDFLNSYQYFAKTLFEMQKINGKGYKYPDIFNNSRDKVVNSFTEYLISNRNHIDKNDITEKFLNKLFEMEKLAGIEKLMKVNEDNIYNYTRCNPENLIEDVIKDIYHVYKYYDKPISDNTFMNLLTNIRKIEHEQDPEKYPFDNDTIFNICFNSNKILALCTLSNNNRTKNVNNIVNAIKKSKVKKML